MCDVCDFEEADYGTCQYCKRATAEGQIAFGSSVYTLFDDSLIIEACWDCANELIGDKYGLAKIPGGLEMYVLGAAFNRVDMDGAMEDIEEELKHL